MSKHQKSDCVFLDHVDITMRPAHGKNSRIDELLLEFISIDCATLAAMHARLDRERDEAMANQTDTVEQLKLTLAADVIGSLRFAQEWEGAKASSQLAQVA